MHALRCPVCRSARTRSFFSQYGVPTQCGYLAPTREQALAAPLGDITLWHCRSCGHIWNSSFDAQKVGFEADYNLSQFHSAAYRRYVVDTIEQLKSRYGLKGKTALEIACGKGDFLRLLLDAGIERVIGFDPTYVDPGFSDSDRQRLVIHRTMYDKSQSALRPDLVACRGCLQYISAPLDFLRSIRETLGEQHSTLVYFETSNSALAFRDKVVWYVMYEAGCFFSACSLARLFRETGFQVLDIFPVLDGAHFQIECSPSDSPTMHESESQASAAVTDADVDGFAREYSHKLQYWSERFAGYRRDGKRVALWAAAMRAISLLTNCREAAEWVEVAADVNVQRQGRFLPKTGHRVVSPDELVRMRPDVVVCTNPTYAREIAEQIAAYGLDCEFEVLL